MPEDLFPPDRTHYFGRGRTAVAWAIERLGMKHGDGIMIPFFICSDLIAAFETGGIEPIYYDITSRLDLDLSFLEKAWRPQAKALLAVNYFGFPFDLEVARNFCSVRNLFLLEDNAHGLFGAYRSQWLGRRGDVGIFSFRKSLSVPDGAACIWNFDLLGAPHPASMDFASARRAAIYRIKEYFRSAVRRMSPVAWAFFIERYRQFISPQEFLKLAEGDVEIRISRYSFEFLKRCDPHAEAVRRREKFAEYADWLRRQPGCRLVFSETDPHLSPYGVPFYFFGPGKKDLQRSFMRRGVEMISWPDFPKGVRLPTSNDLANVHLLLIHSQID